MAGGSKQLGLLQVLCCRSSKSHSVDAETQKSPGLPRRTRSWVGWENMDHDLGSSHGLL